MDVGAPIFQLPEHRKRSASDNGQIWAPSPQRCRIEDIKSHLEESVQINETARDGTDSQSERYVAHTHYCARATAANSWTVWSKSRC